MDGEKPSNVSDDSDGTRDRPRETLECLPTAMGRKTEGEKHSSRRPRPQAALKSILRYDRWSCFSVMMTLAANPLPAHLSHLDRRFGVATTAAARDRSHEKP